jgi:alpha-mannosidase
LNSDRATGIQAWTGFVGQWDNRVWDREFEEVDYVCDGKVVGITPGYIKRDSIAWFCTHRHHPTRGNEAYRFSYLFKYAMEIPDGATSLTLPDDPRVKVLAVSVAQTENDAVPPAAPLYDDFTDRRPVTLRHVYPPPPPPIFEGVTPTAKAIIERKEDFALDLGRPATDDYADQAAGRGVNFAYFDRNGDYTPNSGSGAKDGKLPRLSDGQVAQNDDDTERCVWYDNQGRFFADMGRSVKIDRINTYSWHKAERAPQYFSIWASNAEAMPDAGFKNAQDSGWTLLAVVNSKELGQGGVHGSSIRAAEGAMGPYRWLLWVAEDVGNGTFFTEIDVHVAD